MNGSRPGNFGAVHSEASRDGSQLQPRRENSSLPDDLAIRAASNRRVDVDSQKQKHVACKQCRQAKVRDHLLNICGREKFFSFFLPHVLKCGMGDDR